MTMKIIQAVLLSKMLFIFNLIALSGCAIRYNDSEGGERYIGFFSVRIEKQGCLFINTEKSAGVTIDLTKGSGGINFGVKTVTKSYIGNNTVVTMEESETREVSIKEYNRLGVKPENSATSNEFCYISGEMRS